MSQSSLSSPETRSWRDAIILYTRPRVIGMLFLGFSAGLPFLLVFSTLSAWLRDVGVERSTIGFFSWVGILFSIKVFWAPVIDRVAIPVLTRRLGKRRSWMLLGQLSIVTGLLGMAMTDPLLSLSSFVLLALLVAFGSATQDICIDAYRIEAVEESWQGAMAATYIFGYRLALLVAGAGALYLADWFDWTMAYACMAGLMAVGVVTTLLIAEPEHPPTPSLPGSASRMATFSHWLQTAFVDPFVEFFQRNGRHALVLLLFIAVFRISDITMGVMANPFYLDLGFSKSEIASVAKLFGFFMTIAGSFLGGLMVAHWGLYRPLLIGATMVALTNLLFSAMALQEPGLVMLSLVISADNLSAGIANVVFIAYLSSLTNQHYTATQYALFSSLMTLPGKLVGGFSGMVVDQAGYAWFFGYAALLGVPAIILVIYLSRYDRQQKQVAGTAEETQ